MNVDKLVVHDRMQGAASVAHIQAPQPEPKAEAKAPEKPAEPAPQVALPLEEPAPASKKK